MNPVQWADMYFSTPEGANYPELLTNSIKSVTMSTDMAGIVHNDNEEDEDGKSI